MFFQTTVYEWNHKVIITNDVQSPTQPAVVIVLTLCRLRGWLYILGKTVFNR